MIIDMIFHMILFHRPVSTHAIHAHKIWISHEDLGTDLYSYVVVIINGIYKLNVLLITRISGKSY